MAHMPDGAVQSVQRALRVLNLFTLPRPEWSVGDIARALKLNKSVVSRLLMTMAREGYVVQDPTTKRYSIGAQAFAVGSTYRPFTALDKVLHPIMEQLAQESGHSTSVGVPSGRVFTIISTVQGTNSVRVAFEVGQRPYYHSAAIGKLLLASMCDDDVRAIVGPNPLPKVTRFTIDRVEDVLAELERIRASGVSISDQESIVGVGAVAASIANASGACVAGISVVYPSHLVAAVDIERFSDLTLAAARQVSERLHGAPLPHSPRLS
jgi:DNA-binding IclR family transcriptional regulator